MTNREKYKFDDFTFENYSRLIQLAKDQGFSFILHKDDYVEDRKDVIWRHDVEFSPDRALKMARIESKAGVQSTYFWQLHTDYYNTASRYFSNILLEIASLGHHIGLLFDANYWKISREDQLNSRIMLDKIYLENLCGIQIDTFSFHNTNSFILNNCDELKYGGLINVYSSFYKKHYDYRADSTGIWRYERLEDELLNPRLRHLQVLTHDGVWSDDVLSPHKRIMNCIQDEADRQKKSYMIGLPKSGNSNVDDYIIDPQPNEQ